MTLREQKLLEAIREGARPQHRLGRDSGPLIWLPNTIIDGVEGANAPVVRLRQLGDVMTLRLYIDLYSADDLCAYGGVARSVVFSAFTRATVGELGEYFVYSFTEDLPRVYMNSPVVVPHARNLTPK